jgi:hypothetical protein
MRCAPALCFLVATLAAAIYGQLFEMIPGRSLRSEVLRSDLAFLSQSPMLRQNPPEWFSEVKGLLRHPAVSAADKAWIRDEMKASGDMVMSLYVDAERLAPSRDGLN